MTYPCGACKQPAELVKTARRGVYGYTCSDCGHRGVLPEYDYQLWVERQRGGSNGE
jgi:DNA-directed RNA polymerase subunit RPC12/RpoP